MAVDHCGPPRVQHFWQVHLSKLEDSVRAKYHDHEWLVREGEAGGYYVKHEAEDEGGNLRIFRKGSNGVVYLREQTMAARADRREPYFLNECDYQNVDPIQVHPGPFELRYTFCKATHAQIEYFKSVKVAFDEAAVRDATRAPRYRETEGDAWNCEHVNVAGRRRAYPAPATVFYDFELVRTWLHTGLDSAGEDPVFYSCGEDNLTRHIFDTAAQDCITITFDDITYTKNRFWTKQDGVAGNDMYRLATVRETEWLQRCRGKKLLGGGKGKLVPL